MKMLFAMPVCGLLADRQGSNSEHSCSFPEPGFEFAVIFGCSAARRGFRTRRMRWATAM
jgi:hypothetical protein